MTGGGMIHFTNTERARITLTVEGRKGKPFRTILADRVVPAGGHRFRWNGADDEGTPFPPGDYIVRIRARATYSSSEYFEKEVEFPVRVG